MTKEQKAQIARENGAKSKGPKTAAGKARSSANALKHARRAESLRHLANPHSAIRCNEDGKHFYALFNDLIAFYRPLTQVALDIVREIAIARWDASRLHAAKTAYYNRALIIERHKDHNLPAELIPVECVLNATSTLLKTETQLDRAIDRLHARIARLEYRLRFLDSNFPALGKEIQTIHADETTNERTDSEPTQPIENTSTPLVTDDASEATRATYELFFPGRELIVIDPSDEKPN